MSDSNKLYGGDEEFWNKYIKGRPKIPDSCFDRICQYHAEHGGTFDVVNDVGAGVGVQSPRLLKHFNHVIVSDIVPGNVEQARQRLGMEKYSYRAAKIEDASDMAEASVDMVFAAFAMHHTQYEAAFEAIAKQLKPGGTFAAVITVPSIFDDPRLTDIWHRMWEEGMRVLIGSARERNDRLRSLAHAAGKRDTMPLDEKYFEPGALRIAVNTDGNGWPSYLPEDLQEEFEAAFGESNAVGPNDKIVYEKDPGWEYEADLQALRAEYEALPFTPLAPKEFELKWKEVEEVVRKDQSVRGVWPAKIILATRRRTTE